MAAENSRTLRLRIENIRGERMRVLRDNQRGRKVSDVGDAFRAGQEYSNNRNLKSVQRGHKLLLVGYGWAVYGEKDLNSGKTTYFKGWDKYSNTTSRHLGQTGIRGAGVVSVKAPRLSDY